MAIDIFAGVGTALLVALCMGLLDNLKNQLAGLLALSSGHTLTQEGCHGHKVSDG